MNQMDTESAIVKAESQCFPDGGLTAWLQVLGAFLLYFNTWGILLPTYSTLAISQIGSTQSFLLVFVRVLTGPSFDRGYLQSFNTVGTILLVLELMTTSAAAKCYQIFLAHGLRFRLGCGCMFINMMAIVPIYFATKRPIAMGIASLGTGIGGIIHSVIFHRLQLRIGFFWTLRKITFVVLFLQLVPYLVMCTRLPPSKPRDLVQITAFKSVAYTCITLAAVLGPMGMYVPFYEAQLFAVRKLGTGQTLTFYLTPIMNAGSTVGRLLLSGLAVRFGTINLFSVTLIFSGVICWTWIAVDTIGGSVAFSFWYRFFSGAILVLGPIMIAAILKDMRELGTRIGTSFGIGAFGLLAGNPIVGALVNVRIESFIRAQIFGGVVLLACGGFATVGGVWKLMKNRGA
ncbi:MFS general substrate transporter [Glonium stellatum]|uniref:MFS general substrate transporter n=1 Tax=Glonium stellatum TaxID=574774 RepID=A0A8E2EQT4_9PEZI|nr:MFS general substrate transporter [Glonium stellatum]